DSHAFCAVGTRLHESLLIQRELPERAERRRCVMYITHPSMLNQRGIEETAGAGQVELFESVVSREKQSERNAQHTPGRLPEPCAFEEQALRFGEFAAIH